MRGISKAGTLFYVSHPLDEKCFRKMFLEGIGTEGQESLLRSSAGRNGGSQQRPRHPEKYD
jgi:hypothetical protein